MKPAVRSRAKPRSGEASPGAAVNPSKSGKSRDAILAAAAKSFRSRGYAATTLRQIADAAKLEAGSIYYHFGSKDEILAEVLDRGLRHVSDTVRARVGEAGAHAHRERIGRAIEAHLMALHEASNFTSANIRIYGQLPERLKKKHRPLRRAYAQYWDRLFRDARRDGAIRDDVEIVPLRIFVLGALNWTVEWFDSTKKDAVRQLAARTELLIFEGVSRERGPQHDGE